MDVSDIKSLQAEVKKRMEAAIEHVRRDETHRAVPILVLTTESDAEKKSRARNAGATGWIVKPFNPSKLVDAIRRVAG